MTFILLPLLLFSWFSNFSNIKSEFFDLPIPGPIPITSEFKSCFSILLKSDTDNSSTFIPIDIASDIPVIISLVILL